MFQGTAPHVYKARRMHPRFFKKTVNFCYWLTCHFLLLDQSFLTWGPRAPPVVRSIIYIQGKVIKYQEFYFKCMEKYAQ